MTAQSQLEAYLNDFRGRLKKLIVARGAAIMALAALGITLVAVFFGMRRAFDPEFIIGARTVLALVVLAAVLGLLVYPLRVLNKSRGVAEIERRSPDLEGRIETYEGLARDPERARSPFLSLLAEDALNFARRIPLKLRVRPAEISVPAVLAVIAAGGLVWVAAFGPDTWRYGVRHLWAGWLFDNTLPPQRIVVTPGDGTVRRGGDLEVLAAAEGFDPSTMQLFAQFGDDGGWESAPMSEAAGDNFDFTFFAIREPVRYYVTAAGVRSREYGVEVVDLPEVTGIKLSYNYPGWTGLESAVEDPGSDIRAVEGTNVEVEITTDRPLDNATLVANGEPLEMRSEGSVSRGTLEVDAEGEYHIATLFNEDQVRLTDDYFISVVSDQKPAVSFVKPGRDYRASNIEEVTLRAEASDDFGLRNVELRYSINGGEWHSEPLELGAENATAEQTLYLEEMSPPARATRSGSASRQGSNQSLEALLESVRNAREPGSGGSADEDAAQGEQAAASEDDQPEPQRLEPGDVISYYAVAEDREQTVQTDLFFIEVQPFDRSYTQSTQSGGGGGGGGGQQDEISSRQKEILVATWNLIRESEDSESFLDQQQLEDNADMLAELQRTLAEQAQTLASRTRARQLTRSDERIEQFVEYLELAVESMNPAAERLAEIALDDAVPSEQEALQYLLRAESLFTDIQVSFQQNGGGGGGGLAGRDLSELFELEMDLEKNQYETESPVSLEDSPEQQVDEAISKLQELARRQEQLAREAERRNQLTDRERWQQDELRRETEELRRQLEELQQQMAEAQQQAEQQQQGQEGEQGQQGQQQGQQSQQPGQPGQPGQAQGGQQQAQAGGQNSRTQQAIRQLDEALQAMDRARAQDQEIDPEQARRAVEQARRQLQQALEQMTAERQAAAGEAFSDLSERSEELFERQRQLAAEIQGSLQRALDEQIEQRNARGGLSRTESMELGQRKQELQRELETLEEDIQRVAQDFARQTPGASDRLGESLADLQQSQAVARLRYAADRIMRGAAEQVAATEAVTTSALRDLQRGTEEARRLAEREAVAGESSEPSASDELVAEIQSLRRQLSELNRQNAQGAGGQQQNAEQGEQPGQGGQQQDAEQGGPGQGGQQQAQAGGQPGGRAGGSGGFFDPDASDVWDPRSFGWANDPERVERAREQLQQAGSDLINLGNRLRAEGLTDEELRAVRELGDALREGLSGNEALIEAEFQGLVDLAEQLELRLREQNQSEQQASVRSEAPVQVAQGFEEVVAEYFRRLSRSETEDNP